MNNISDKITKYVRVNPQLFSFTMLGLSTMMLVYFVAHNDEDNELENVTKEAESEVELEGSKEEEEVSPQQGGSKRRKNKSKKTKRRHR